jgi:3-deoxy-D-manno-octulosonic-acid transferase
MHEKISAILCQSDSDMARFVELGVPKSKMSVTGSMKFDIALPEGIDEKGWEIKNRFGHSRPIWIAASTHLGEDEIILAAHKKIQMVQPSSLLILVPRHPERFDSVYEKCIEQGFNTYRHSSNDTQAKTDCDIYLGDTLGELMLLLSASDICFMGGSLIGEKVGGHNVLEPAVLGKPIITGPSYYNFQEICDELIQRELLIIANDPDSIATSVTSSLSNPAKINDLKSKLQAFMHENQGALNTTVTTIMEFDNEH